MLHEFIPGQRCISDAELQMGLGTVLTVEFRTLTVLFMATGETRTYAKLTAPLTRVAFEVGDTITSHDGRKVKVNEVCNVHGLLSYVGLDEAGTMTEVEEGQLDNFLKLNRPSERLFNGQIDADKWFELRYETLQHRHRLAHSELTGLTGCRTSLIPHQLYIAHEVANRYAPRVLLADEVGLGKTIEAGLILHHQLLTERANRILIVVPETLVHQWLVEMLRRFNLHFKIFDEERWQSLQEDLDEGRNPFHSEQLVLCSLGFLRNNIDCYEQAMDGDWDLLIVDEAHHLEWSPEEPSIEYQLIEGLAMITEGVLLLTATPEQLGKESHFARLRLLDPDRFHSFEQFVAEEESYEPIAQVVEDLLSDKPLTKRDISTIKDTFSEGDNQALFEVLESSLQEAPVKEKNASLPVTTAKASVKKKGSTLTISKRKKPSEDDIKPVGNKQARLELVEHLLDRHGTGRVLFRNTRAAVKGFPEREVFGYPLALPEAYADLKTDDAAALLTPESSLKKATTKKIWTSFDPRIEWLAGKLGELVSEKVLVIAAHAETALDIAQHLKTKTGIHAAVFHEGLSIVERDRAAAYFADKETGTQVLICSEIGSEGRNFQFAHHMVLFDLPLNPDLLEQRIGRLDRIGQTQTIRIHVPYLENSAQAVMFNWYQNGLAAFEKTCPIGHTVYSRVEESLTTALHSPESDDSFLIIETQELRETLVEDLQRGRDRLLEYNSCRTHIAQALKEKAIAADDEGMLADYMENVFDCFGVDTEMHSENCLILSQTEMMVNNFPGLTDEGMTITYSRDTALSFEDAHFITWEHPMTVSTLDMVLAQEMGNTAVTAADYAGVPRGTMLLECLYTLEAAPVEFLQTERYLPPTVIRILLDEKGVDHNAKLAHEIINAKRAQVDIDTANKVVRAKQPILKAMLEHCEKTAQLQVSTALEQAHRDSSEALLREVNRLTALSKVNPNVRASEIEFFENELAALSKVLDSASLRLDALRVMVAT